ncbi:MAG: hypothetical protein HRU20_07365 [Pseudomonadales bacterium]|nr:hypothetical protein [Pseudomonadales bacterium]
MKFPRLFLVNILALTLLAGCSTNPYSAPEIKAITSQASLNISKYRSWNNLKHTLPTQGFKNKQFDTRLNTMDYIFKSVEAEKYVDCGFLNLNNDAETGIGQARYNLAGGSRYQVTSDNDEQLLNVVRKTSLIARVKIFFAEGEGVKKSLIRVNIAYQIDGELRYYTVDNRLLEKELFQYKLSTRHPKQSQYTTCISRGVLEQNVFDAAL